MPKICGECNSEYIYSEFLECWICPVCTPPLIDPIITKVLGKCPICGQEKTPLVAMCEPCTGEAEKIIKELGKEKFDPEKITTILKQRRLKPIA